MCFLVQKLFAIPGNYRTYKAQIAAQISGKKVDLAGDFQMGTTNTSADFLSKFPLGKVNACSMLLLLCPCLCTKPGISFHDAILWKTAETE
jgi:hypothetical protein